MKYFTALWLDTPRWVRGLFLGNLCYVVLVAFGFGLLQNNFAPGMIFAPLIWLVNLIHLEPRYILYHVAWCVFGALFVQFLGERKGIILLVSLIYGIGIAFLMYTIQKVII